VLRASSAVRWGLLPVFFGLGVLVGRGSPATAESNLMPVTGVARGADVAAPAPPAGESDVNAAERARAASDDAASAHKASKAKRKAQHAAGEAAEQRSWSELASHAQRGTVGILAGDRYGAGIIVDRSGLVLTNLHVVQGIDKISVLLVDDESLEATLVAQAGDLDLALLRLPRALPEAAELGSSKSVHVGDEVLAVGSPRKMFFSVSRGTVSYLNRKLDSVQYLQTDLPINAGNSGGPLLDRDGKVVGVVSFILRDSQGIAFALPIDYALERFAAELQPTATAAVAGAR
jgi:S1-C subfamily serine protease